MNEKALLICNILQKSGFQAVIAGGAVRDMIMNFEPHDWDIATNAKPEIVSTILKKNKFIVKEVGKAFGVVLAKKENEEFEIATFRTESGYTDGRHPDKVEFSSMEEDAQRRDLTINAIFFDPVNNKFIDFVHGEEDIHNKVIRFVGDPNERISEDKLRMLRVVRFAIKFGWNIDPATFQAIVNHSSEINIISSERIHQELEKMFACKKPSLMVDLLISTGLMKEILPEVSLLDGLRQDPRWHPEGSALMHTKLVMEQLKNESFELQLAALFHDLGKFDTFEERPDGSIGAHGHAEKSAEKTIEILKRLKFSNDQIEYITNLVGDHMKALDCMNMKKSTLRRLIAQPYFDDLLKLAEADDEASKKDFRAIKFLKEKKLEFASEIKLPEPLIKGSDLIQLGLKPGPQFKILLESVMDKQLEGSISTKEEGIQFIKEEINDK